jgi:ABC-type molybdenum transport system ATPase subunit/photorepair protein PhrA
MRRRVALLRALLKRPQALVLAGAFGGGSAEDAAMRKLARAEAPQAAILLSADDETVCADADLVARLDAQGAFEIDAPAVKTGGRADIVETQGS